MAIKMYVYKMQWLFQIRLGWDSTEEKNRKDVINLVKILGARSLSEINFLNKDLVRVVKYNRMHQFSPTEADRDAIKVIKQTLKERPDVIHIEILRK